MGHRCLWAFSGEPSFDRVVAWFQSRQDGRKDLGPRGHRAHLDFGLRGGGSFDPRTSLHRDDHSHGDCRLRIGGVPLRWCIGDAANMAGPWYRAGVFFGIGLSKDRWCLGKFRLRNGLEMESIGRGEIPIDQRQGHTASRGLHPSKCISIAGMAWISWTAKGWSADGRYLFVGLEVQATARGLAHSSRPAWSSFAFSTKYLVTQEQRGEKESVVCYDADTGKELWESSLESRFFESLGGLGPRATPTIAAGNVYALGAEGWFVKLNATNGKVEWKADVRKDAERDPPMWGFSSSPFVVGDLAIIHAGGKGDKGVLAYDNQTGALRWSVPAGEHSYGSLQMVRLVDRDFLCLLSNLGAHLWDPSNGQSVLEYAWEHSGYRALQPQVIDGDKLLIPTGMGSGCRLVQLSESNGAIDAKELWTSREMKPDFNDVVVHKGHIYGFDNSIFACIDLKDGKRKWKGGRYGKGQCLLLPKSDLIIVLAESGELALVKATESSHQELAKFQSVEGKTWNHPVVVGNRLYVRNAAEAVCYRLD